jgi:uncharacterized repeat protein (TIGR01451 family)
MATTTLRSTVLAALVAGVSLLAASCTAGNKPATQSGSTLSASGFTLWSSSAAGQALTMSTDMASAMPGGQVVFTVIAQNTTPATLTDGEVDVTFPLTKIAVTDVGSGVVNDDRISWTIPTLAAGESKTFTYKTTLSSALTQGDVVRTVVSFRAKNLAKPATASAQVRVGPTSVALASSSSSSVASVPAVPPTPSADTGYTFFIGSGSSSSVETAASSTSSSAPVIAQQGSLTLTQQADQGERQPGQAVRYTIQARNTSSADLTNIPLQVVFPPVLTVSSASDGGVVAPNQINWTIPTLAAGQTVSFTYDGRLATTLKQGDVVTTVAQVTLPQGLPEVATTDVHVIGSLPTTGAEDRFFAPLDSQYLTPIK